MRCFVVQYQCAISQSQVLSSALVSLDRRIVKPPCQWMLWNQHQETSYDVAMLRTVPGTLESVVLGILGAQLGIVWGKNDNQDLVTTVQNLALALRPGGVYTCATSNHNGDGASANHLLAQAAQTIDPKRRCATSSWRRTILLFKTDLMPHRLQQPPTLALANDAF